MFSFHWISTLLISVTFYTHLPSIIFNATWPLRELRLLYMVPR